MPEHLRTKGFSLVEMMVVIAVMGILAAIATPAFRDMIQNQRVRNAAAELHSSLALARSEALKRNTSVTVSAIDGNWSNGWQIANPALSDALIESRPAIPEITVSGPASVTYRSSGRTQAASDFTITSGSHTRCLNIDLSGRPSIKSSC